MRFSFMTLLRLAVLAGLGSTLLAIEVARLAPHAWHARVLRKSRVVGIPGIAFPGPDECTRFLDIATGSLTRLTLPDGEFLDDAVCSPWEDDEGVSHVIGRWRKDEGKDGMEVMTDLGLACYTYPGGEEVARVPCAVLPQGGACWYPGTGDRVLFSGADGALYHVAFETGSGRRTQPAGDEGAAVPLRWDVPKPGTGAVLIREPYWPAAPGFEHTVLVSVRYVAPEPSDGLSLAEIWWLRLDARGVAVVAAGRLTTPGGGYDESSPSLAATPGGLVLAYVTCEPKQRERKLRVAPVKRDPKTRAWRADAGRAVLLAHDCADTPAAFSPDGRSVYALLHPKQPGALLKRLAVPRAWPAEPASVGGRRDAHAG
jgi:hypothetical protein